MITNEKKTAERIIEEKAETYAGLILDVRKRSGAFSGYIAGYRSAAQETAALREENERLKEVVKELIDYSTKSQHEKSLIKYDDFLDMIENAKKLTGQI